MTATSVAAVEIAAGDGVVLRGQRWAGPDCWVILLHDLGTDEDLDRWAPLTPRLAARGWTVVAVDLRGHGASDGEPAAATVAQDIAAVVAFARAGGATFLSVVAAGQSALAALRSAAAIRADALVLLSPALGADEPVAELRGAGEAKLIVAGGGDPAMRAASERLCQRAIGWAMLLNLPTADQGTALLTGPVAAHLTEHVTGFLAEQRFLAERRPGRRGAASTSAAEAAERTERG